jgi:hypothetical protein
LGRFLQYLARTGFAVNVRAGLAIIPQAILDAGSTIIKAILCREIRERQRAVSFFLPRGLFEERTLAMQNPNSSDYVGHVSLDRAMSRLVDDWRRRQPLIPSRRVAVHELLRQALAKAQVEQRPAS